MNPLTQNLIALLLVAACVGYVGWQMVRSIGFGRGKAGSCCGKGCAAHEKPVEQKTTEKKSTGEQFISSDALKRRRA